MRHAGILSALLATALLMCAVPGLARLPVPQGRADEHLRTPELHTLTVWLLPGETDDRKLISRLCAAYEKERKGVRIFLRTVTADEFSGETAVLPDVALFDTGSLTEPERFFLPLLPETDRSGTSAGVQRAAALWFAPNVLSLPLSWLNSSAAAAEHTDSLLAAATATPEPDQKRVLNTQEIPWELLLQSGAVLPAQGVGWQQLLTSCPVQWRARLTEAVLHPAADTPSPVPKSRSDELPRPHGVSPTPFPAAEHPARVETLASHQARLQKGEAICAGILNPAVSDHVRYAALCRNNPEAQQFLQYLLSGRESAMEYGLLPLQYEGTAADVLVQALLDHCRTAVLPNAFAHTRQEIQQLCADGFARCTDPVQTLLQLR